MKLGPINSAIVYRRQRRESHSRYTKPQEGSVSPHCSRKCHASCYKLSCSCACHSRPQG